MQSQDQEWDDGRLLFHELLDATSGFTAFVDGDRSRGLTETDGLEEAREHLNTFLALEGSSAVFVPRDVRALVGVSLDALDRGQIEVALTSLRRASFCFQAHLDRERRQGGR
jgi:hypothetical protein